MLNNNKKKKRLKNNNQKNLKLVNKNNKLTYKKKKNRNINIMKSKHKHIKKMMLNYHHNINHNKLVNNRVRKLSMNNPVKYLIQSYHMLYQNKIIILHQH